MNYMLFKLHAFKVPKEESRVFVDTQIEKFNKKMKKTLLGYKPVSDVRKL
jgi:hypothetical protein